jgi:hypothetical protein
MDQALALAFLVVAARADALGRVYLDPVLCIVLAWAEDAIEVKPPAKRPPAVGALGEAELKSLGGKQGRDVGNLLLLSLAERPGRDELLNAGLFRPFLGQRRERRHDGFGQ